MTVGNGGWAYILQSHNHQPCHCSVIHRSEEEEQKEREGSGKDANVSKGEEGGRGIIVRDFLCFSVMLCSLTKVGITLQNVILCILPHLQMLGQHLANGKETINTISGCSSSLLLPLLHMLEQKLQAGLHWLPVLQTQVHYPPQENEL